MVFWGLSGCFWNSNWWPQDHETKRLNGFLKWMLLVPGQTVIWLSEPTNKQHQIPEPWDSDDQCRTIKGEAIKPWYHDIMIKQCLGFGPKRPFFGWDLYLTQKKGFSVSPRWESTESQRRCRLNARFPVDVPKKTIPVMLVTGPDCRQSPVKKGMEVVTWRLGKLDTK